MKRVITAAVAIPLVVLTTRYASDWIFAFVVGLAAALAVEEFLSLGAARGIGRPGKWFLAPAALVAISFMGDSRWVLNSLSLSTIALLSVTAFGHSTETALGRVGMGLSGVVYCSATLGFLVLMARDLTREWIFVLFGIIWVGDAAAYYGGRAVGRRPLAPKVSPKKTVEGAIAGFLGSMIAGVALGVWLVGERWLHLLAISGVTAIAGQLGDLAESALKRSAGVKDSSSILPGHGGILDRLDSLFFATPVFYWCYWFFRA